jgi:putative Mn2+ efflux pump MntP
MLAIALIGISLSMDAFAVTVVNGICIRGFNIRHALVMAAYFGAFQFLMPLIGSFLASTVSEHISLFGPYISFVILAFIGIRMIRSSYKDAVSRSGGKTEATGANLSGKRLLVLAVATSIDALAVGVSFAFMDIMLLPACLLIGAITFVVCVAGGMIGCRIPWLTGSRAELAGGVILTAIGIKILLEGVL